MPTNPHPVIQKLKNRLAFTPHEACNVSRTAKNILGRFTSSKLKMKARQERDRAKVVLANYYRSLRNKEPRAWA